MGDERPQPALARVPHAGAPERRLPDARLAAEHDRARRRRLVVDERKNLAELVLPAEDWCAHALTLGPRQR
jgi:hypothetical protein